MDPQKAVQKYRKKPKLVGKLNEQNALFHYSYYRKPRSGVVNVLRQVQRLVANGFGRRRLTCLRWSWSGEEFGMGIGRTGL